MTLKSSDFLRIIKYCIISRLTYVAISVLSIFCLPDHHPTDVFVSPSIVTNVSKLDNIVFAIFKGFSYWDAQHFYHIADYGYTYEHNLAFFPLFPGILSCTSALIYSVSFGYLNIRSCNFLASFIVNFILFTASALRLYKLSLQVLLNSSLALKAVLFYCVSPASIFFVCAYSETLYAFLSFSGMLMCSQGKLLMASYYFALASFTRSNGIINSGFILHGALFHVYHNFNVTPFPKVSFLLYLLKTILCTALVFTPYILFQVYSYLLYCSKSLSISIPPEIVEYAVKKSYVLPTDDIVWCQNSLPLAYSYVQDHYWNVGLFKYYSIKQIPNFVLASPIAVLVGVYSVRYLKHFWRLIYLVRYVYISSLKPNDWRCPRNNSLLPRSAFVYIVHALFLLLFCILFINVQVTTRLIASSSPLIYWIAARYYVNNPRSTSLPALDFFPFNETSSKITGKLIKLYFVTYCITGIIAFSNNFPWT